LNKKYLICIYYFSKFVELSLMNDCSSKSVITELKSIFARYGISITIISDNGPPFSSQQFKDFTKDWDITHTTTSPYHPQANGQVERLIQTFKKMIVKAIESNSDPFDKKKKKIANRENYKSWSSTSNLYKDVMVRTAVWRCPS